MTHTILPRAFYDQSTLDLAKALLGKLLVHETSEGICSGYIVETEAYRGPDDQAAHSYNNLRTKRTEVMFGENGHCYAHVMHTHCLINVVSGGVDRPEGVLIRALEPVDGIDLMYKRREKAKREKDLTSGPGKLTKALNITKADYGKSFFQPPLYIAEGKEVSQISMGPRIGIDNSGEAKDYPWRFWETGNPYVSR
ncbi:DNA-3-methyladenine glycosylase [Alkalihalophilus marmarensis]|jgi:DNA-3-methyladenine glycosylase|uniref:Putative 3-methyladenine DNA glycosylase n=1 Tax=Alkalihalophilus marmarensis DSM 21297 TaxID=1188261 RepID=U6SPC4_9BACI|nr:DNA-3-methyladenine glycosylase [Alkalihalophilus marmarensis]ERN53569.1 3-methyladenine DNA glycosylase [Alkalihalophilus marmarensis DSM 21297]MCM3490053.1 DNA-3-methyladenine glycosylase [Alkalihalophilus marmarensis]